MQITLVLTVDSKLLMWRCYNEWNQTAALVVNYGIYITIVLEIPQFTTKIFICAPIILSPNYGCRYWVSTENGHDDVIKLKYFPRYWPFVWGIHRWPVNSPHKGQWRGALMFSLVCAWINGWVNDREAGDLRRNRTHYDVILMDQSNLRRNNPINRRF